MAGAANEITTDVVGYNSTDMYTNGKFTAVVVPFLNITDKAKGLSLYDITIENVTKSNVGANADQIWIWKDGLGWDKFFIKNDGTWKRLTANQYFGDEGVYENGLPEGTGLYIKAKGQNAKAVISSGVVDTINPEVSSVLFANAKFTYVGNPYPVTTKITDSVQFEIENVTKSNVGANADQIWIWKDGLGWDKFFIKNDGTWKRLTANQYFGDEGVYENGLPVGSVLYIKTKGAATNKEAVFKSPFTVE